MNNVSIKLSEIEISFDETYHIYKGKPLYNKRFKRVMSFHIPGVAAVEDDTGAYHINLEGKPIYKNKFKKTFGYYQDVAAVVDESGWYHIDLAGKPIYPQRYSWVGNFQEGRCVVRDFDGNYFHITLNGSPAYNAKYRYAGDFKYGIAVVYCENGLARHIDKNGRFIHTKSYSELDVFHKGYSIAKDSKGYFHINKHGEPIYEERYARIEPFYNGYALVKRFDGTVGRINEDGEWVETLFREYSKNGANEKNIIKEVTSDLVGFWKTQILYSSIKLGVLEYLNATNGSSLNEISSNLKINLNGLQRLLNTLAIMKYVRRINKTESYELTEKGKFLVEHLKYATLMWGEEHYIAMSGLWWSIKEGKSYFEKEYGKNFFAYLNEYPRKLETYQRAIEEYAKLDYPGVAEIIARYSRYKVIIDVGGGTGTLLKLILERNSFAKGILFETKPVIEIAKKQVLSEKIKNRLSFLEGDFFSSIPITADAIILSRVLHDWDDKKATKILSNVYNALSTDGILFIVEIIKPDSPLYDLGFSLNLNMLCVTGGKERTKKEFERLLEVTGFMIKEIIPKNILNILVASKKL